MKLIKILIIVIACLNFSSQTSKRFFDIKGKVALITGGVGGIGKAYAKELLRNGCKGVSLVDKNSTNAAKIIKELEKKFGKHRAIFIKADVTDSTALEGSFQTTCDCFNQLDIVINNAGITDEQAQNGKLLLDTNLVAVAVGTQLAFKKFLPKYKKGAEGVVVNTASIVGLVPVPTGPFYSSSKTGVVTIGRTMGHPYYYNENKIKILTLCPGGTNTPMLQGLGDPPFEDKFADKSLRTVQEPKVVGKALIIMLKQGETGSVWLINNSKLKKVDFTAADKAMRDEVVF